MTEMTSLNNRRVSVSVSLCVAYGSVVVVVLNDDEMQTYRKGQWRCGEHRCDLYKGSVAYCSVVTKSGDLSA